MTGFQNSMRKNSWQKPNSLYEMNGGGNVFQGAFDREDAARQPARDADEAGLSAILDRPKGRNGKPLMDKNGNPVLSDVEDLAAKAHQEFVKNEGTGHHGVGEAEASVILSGHRSWRSLSDSARKHAIDTLISHINDIHRDYTASKSKLKEETEEDEIIARYQADREGEILADERLANRLHRESESSGPETVMDAARELVAAYEAFKRKQKEIEEAPPGPAWPDNRPPHFRKENR